MKKLNYTLVAALAGIFLTACTTVGPDYVKPEPKAGVSDEWSSQELWDGRLEGVIADEELDPKALAEWWTVLNDRKLSSLIERASDANLDLRTATARLRQARAHPHARNARAGDGPGAGRHCGHRSRPAHTAPATRQRLVETRHDHLCGRRRRALHRVPGRRHALGTAVVGP